MACVAENVSRTRRTVMTIGIECSPAVDKNATTARVHELEQFALYENFNPLQGEFDVITLNRAKNQLGPEGVGIGMGRFTMSGSVYCVGSGIANVPPVWTKFLRISGWRETRYVKTDNTAPAVTGVTITASTATGSLTPSSSYNYKFGIVKSYTGVLCEGLTSTSKAGNTSAGNNTNTIDWSGEATINSGSVSYVHIYRTKAGGSTYYLVAKVKNPSVTTSYVDNSADDELSEAVPTQDASLNEVDWVPASENIESATIYNYLNSRLYEATGCRGTMSFDGDAGQLFEGRFNVMGLYNDSTQTANPTVTPNPGIPPRVCNIGLVVTPQLAGVNSSDISPIVKHVGINLGTRPTERLDGNQDGCLKEIGIYQEYEPHWTTTVEVDPSVDWMAYFKAGYKFKLVMTIRPGGTPAAGTSIEFKSQGDGTTFGAQLATAPSFTDVGGIRCFALDFLLCDVDSSSSDDSNFLTIRQY